MRHTFPFLSLVLFSSLAVAQERRPPGAPPAFVEIWQNHAPNANGAINPQAIPYGHAMERVFWELGVEARLGSPRFVQRLRTRFPVTDDDARLIAEIAAQSYEISGAIENEATLRYDQICADLRGTWETASALDVAARFDAVERQKAEQLTAHYQAALAPLSPTGRSGLEAHVDTTIRPRMAWGHDLVGLALKVPDVFLAQRKKVCERRLATPASEKLWRHTETAEALDVSKTD